MTLKKNTEDYQKVMSRSTLLDYASRALKNQINYSDTPEGKLIFAVFNNGVSDATGLKYYVNTKNGHISFSDKIAPARAWVHPSCPNFRKWCVMGGLDVIWVANVMWDQIEMSDDFDLHRANDFQRKCIKMANDAANDWLFKRNLTYWRKIHD